MASLRYFFLVWLCPLIDHAAAAPSAPTPALQVIIAKTLANDEARQKELQSMQYDQTANVEDMDSHGKVTDHDVLQMIIKPGAKPAMQVVSMKSSDGSTADPADAEAEGEDVEGNKQTFTLHDLVDRFTVSFAGTAQLRGQSVYVLAFVPKPDQPYQDDTEKVVDQLQGHIWISTRTYNVLQTEATLAHPVSVAWFFASVPTLDFQYRTEDSESGFAPSQVKINLQVNAPFVGFHERQTIDITNFRAR